MPFKELQPEEWMTEIERGLEFRRRFGLEDKWGELEAIYYNVHESMLNDGPNILLSQGDSMLSTITVPAPYVQIVGQRPEAVGKAPIVESIDNTLLGELAIGDEANRAALFAFLFGVGFAKIGYDSEYGYSPDLDMGGALQLGLTLTQLNEKGTRRLESDCGVIPGMPWMRAVMPHDIVVPWGTDTLSRAPWIAHRFVRHVDDLKADQKYSSVRNLRPQISMEDFVNSYKTRLRRVRSGASTRRAEFVECWEIHDRRTGKIYVVVPDHQRFIRNEENALQIENQLPFVSMSFTPTTRSIWTTPDAYYLYYVQNELSDVATQRTKQRRLSTLKFLYDSDVISDEELDKILSPEVGAAAHIEAGRKVNEAIFKLDNRVDQTLAFEEEHLRQNAREQIGFSRNQLGEYTGGRKTATEAGIVDRSSQLRMSRRGLSVKRFYESSFKIINNIIFNYWTLPRYVEVLGAKKAEQWIQVAGTTLRDRYSYNISFSDEAENRARKFESLQLYAMLAADPSVDPVALREFLINEVNDPAFERIFNADIQLALSALRQNGGVVQPQNGGQRRIAQLPSLPGQNGKTSSPANRPLLA